MDKKIITSNFSRYAHLYDKYADVQKRVALEILSQIEGDKFNKVLEIGCGTGNYTILLRKQLKEAKITAIDISPKMIEVAQDKLKDKSVEFIVGDAESGHFPANQYDLVTSNACFQWFEDLERALEKYRALLKKRGAILFSIFGPLTFWELNTALGSVLKNTPIAASNFIDKNDIIRILGNNFNELKIKELKYEESFGSLLALLNKIKYTGARGNGLGNKISFSVRYLKEIEKAYLSKFRQIKATYQVFSCWGTAQ
ncbi:MAG: malonyl-ACP O-methyltransferase BioC [Candidatus Omnitrophica bacterium]|nr:malonyl-ACP O-methyltransferase BioC [Candidatus Omnitrophota bacterium]